MPTSAMQQAQPAFAGGFAQPAVSSAAPFPTAPVAAAPVASPPQAMPSAGFTPTPLPLPPAAEPEVGIGGWVPAPAIPGVSELSMAAGYGTVTNTALDLGVSPSWYGPTTKFLGPPPTNGIATAGLVLSLVGIWVFGLIFSIAGLVKAGRIRREGFAPVGRTRAGWGLAVALICLAALPVVAIYALPALQEQFAGQQLASFDSDSDSFASPPLTGTYDHAQWEQLLSQGFVDQGEAAPESVTCPETADYAMGTSIACTIVWSGFTFISTTTITDELGNNVTEVVQQ